MQPIKLVSLSLLILSSLAAEANAGVVKTSVDNDGKLNRVIWLTPTGDRTVILPGFVNYCSPPTTAVIVATTYAATTLSDKSQWTQKLSFGVDLGPVTENNAQFIEDSTFKITCEVQVSEKKAIDITLPFRIDFRQRHENEDKYAINMTDDRVINSIIETPVKKGARLEFGRRYSFRDEKQNTPKASTVPQIVAWPTFTDSPEDEPRHEERKPLKNGRSFTYPVATQQKGD